MNRTLESAGKWFLDSGIQDSAGGVARYYLIEHGKNLPVSNEITGYAASALAYLHARTGLKEYRCAASKAAHFLTETAWDAANNTFPFEPGSDLAYFFDTGIIVRGLMAVWRTTGKQELLGRAREAAQAMANHFLDRDMFHPVVMVKSKEPLPVERRWSRSPGCFHLKVALAWREVGIPNGEELYEEILRFALRTHAGFFESEPDREKRMDRLHAYSYFLEGLLAVADRPEVQKALAGGLERASTLRRTIAPIFERSDVVAQILRVRLIAHHLGAVELDEQSAWQEAERITSFQAVDEADIRLRGGFFFGVKGGQFLPFSNPVSTAFCLQALDLWQAHRAGLWSFDLSDLI